MATSKFFTFHVGPLVTMQYAVADISPHQTALGGKSWEPMVP